MMSSDDYDIGYGRPPRYTRFRKGKSGNPAGRPKIKADQPSPVNDKKTDDILREQLARKIVTQGKGGGTRKMKVLEAVSLSQQKSALAGNSAAQRPKLQPRLSAPSVAFAINRRRRHIKHARGLLHRTALLCDRFFDHKSFDFG